MIDSMRSGYVVIQVLMQRAALIALSGLALFLTAYTIACVTGHAEWLTLPLTFGTTTLDGGGIVLQSGMTALAVALCFFLPANGRIMALETSHRRFHIGMQDVARAYRAAHSADRRGVFTLSAEFDSIRERMAHLREHPDLSDLEPSVLEVAAQMSHLSRDLARVYSDRNVARARDFLIQRQQEVEDFTRRLDHAKTVATDMRRWLDRVELDEKVAQSQLGRLCDELTGILPELHDAPPAPAHAAAAPAPDAAWREAAPHQDDARIVSILGQRAAE